MEGNNATKVQRTARNDMRRLLVSVEFKYGHFCMRMNYKKNMSNSVILRSSLELWEQQLKVGIKINIQLKKKNS